MTPINIIGVVGTRRRNSRDDYAIIEKTVLHYIGVGDWLCSGGCPRGADRFAEEISREHAIPILIFPADWKKLGLEAGIIRNTPIATNSTILIACVSDDRRGGTEDTIKKFKKFHPDGKLVLITVTAVLEYCPCSEDNPIVLDIEV